ncbi:hypothetical protein KP509_09G050000 [Ceratopteris richardii]|uniref:Uncharacterized protein n=1 Tax=Ceratopteris richardii TaxID=49495 RepID=A0A8T2U6C2_CERRI|nr:hypothetical protein KP509_09G050000 [Ceratopteris richardii]
MSPSSIFSGLMKLRRSWLRCKNYRFFSVEGISDYSLRAPHQNFRIALNGRCRARVVNNLGLYDLIKPFVASHLKVFRNFATREKPTITLPPIVTDNPDSIIPSLVDNHIPIEIPPHRIDKPVTIIAGASRGLGFEFTRQILAKHLEGPVFAACRNPDGADNLSSLKGQYPSRLKIRKLDVTDESSVKVVAKEIYESYGRLDLYINTVGILHIPDVLSPERKIDQFEEDQAMLAFKVNAVGPAIVAKHMIPLLKFGQGEGTSRGGAVLAHLSAKVGSIDDNKLGGWYSYRASKAALNQLTRTMGVECLRLKLPIITVLLHPGTVDTDLSKPFSRNVSPDHLFTPTASVAKLLNVIDGLKPEDSAKFFNYDKLELPW